MRIIRRRTHNVRRENLNSNVRLLNSSVRRKKQAYNNTVKSNVLDIIFSSFSEGVF